VASPAERRDEWRDRIDRVLTHRIAGPILFLVLMGATFQSVFSWAQPAMNLIDVLVGRFSALVGRDPAAGAARIAARRWRDRGRRHDAHIHPADRHPVPVHQRARGQRLHGPSRVHHGSTHGARGALGARVHPAAVVLRVRDPGIMATRTIDNRRDRFTTIMVAPFMSCSARLPVYALLIGAFVPNRWIGPFTLPGLTLFSMYLLGVLVAIGVAAVLKRTVLRGGKPLYIMELPRIACRRGAPCCRACATARCCSCARPAR
jgi:ferrous iron transport protein B